MINYQLINKNNWRLLCGVIFIACSVFFSSGVLALGLGEVVLHSHLGQALHVQVPISGASEDDLNDSCIQATVNTIEGDFIANPRLQADSNQPASDSVPMFVHFVTKTKIVEPIVVLSITMKCGSFMQRTYSLLLDYAEISPPVSSPLVNNLAPPKTTKTTPDSISRKFAVPMAIKNTAEPGKRVSSSAGMTKKPKTIIKAKNRIGTKPNAKVTAPSDQLKVSNAEISGGNTMSPSAKLAEKSLVDIDQQRIQENRRAQQQFAGMLLDEPALLAAQAVTINEGKEKIQKLEMELEQLKLQIQSKSQSQSQNKPEPNFMMSLMVINAVALILLFVLLLVVGKLWFSLRKMRQDPRPGNLWGEALVENNEKVEKIKNVLISQIDDVDLEPALNVPERGTKKSAQIMHEASQTLANIPDESRVDPNILNRSVSDAASRVVLNKDRSPYGQSIQTEELSDFTQEAEFWVSVNEPKRAIEILEPQSLNEDISMPVTLLYLLDLYRLAGEEKKYVELSARLKNKFNIEVLQFDDTRDQSKWKYLEDYEHIIARCSALWNTNAIVPYLESLLTNGREGERRGFELSVYREILLLISICKELSCVRNSSVATV
ncbi:MAG: hypothetical protein K0R08_1994 [Solimicrobium sp.]|jgi:hypothetical protein|nr:hypothetical protein [Solimicrobium sp.]